METSEERNEDGTFKRGHQVNAGKIKKRRTIKLIRNVLDTDEIEALVAMVYRQVMDGCTASQKAILDRAFPIARVQQAELLDEVDNLRDMIDEHIDRLEERVN